MTGFLELLKWEALKKWRRDSRLILLYKGLKGKASIPTDDLIPLVRHCMNDHSMAYQVPIANTNIHKCSFFPQTIRDWNHFQTLLSPLLKVLRMVLLSSLLWWELGTNLPGHGPGEWLSFWRVTSKHFWFWYRSRHILSVLRYTPAPPPHLAYIQIHTSVCHYQYSFFPMTVVLWNRLPADLVFIPILTPSKQESERSIMHTHSKANTLFNLVLAPSY